MVSPFDVISAQDFLFPAATTLYVSRQNKPRYSGVLCGPGPHWTVTPYSVAFFVTQKGTSKMIDKLKHIKALNGMPKDEWRFWAKVDTNGPTMPHMESPCWIWQASKNSGYGTFNLGNKQTPAHRCAWFFVFGELLSSEIILLHQCDNPPCVNPEHLSTGTHLDNMQDMAKKGRAMRGIQPKINIELAREARRIYRSGEVTQQELAQRYGVTTRCMQDLLSLKTHREWTPKRLTEFLESKEPPAFDAREMEVTPKQLLILVAVRSLQPTGFRQVARFLNRPSAAIRTYIYSSNGLIKRGYLTNTIRKVGTLHLSKLGELAVRNMALIRENGIVSLGEVETL